MIFLVIVEDNISLSQNLVEYFSLFPDEISKVIHFNSVEALLDYNDHTHPHIILLDVNLPGQSGIEGIPAIKQKFIKTDIVISSVMEDSQTIFNALCAGASGFIEKDIPLEKVKESVITLYRGGSPITPSIARKVLHFFRKTENINDQLTEKENKVAEGIVEGLSYKLIALKLDISIDTVRKHIKNIYAKLHINSKGELLNLYHKNKSTL